MRRPCTILLLLISCSLMTCPKSSAQCPLPEARPLYCGTDTASVTFIGDVMMHTRQLEYPYREFLGGISEALRSSTAAVANIEFTMAGEPYSGYPAFSAPDGYAQYLTQDCGIDVFLLANNHIMDKGLKGLERTLEVCDTLQTFYTGAAADEHDEKEDYPLIITTKGIKIALINFTYGTNVPGTGKSWPKPNYMNRRSVKAAIGRAEDRGADFIIALPHWGEEYSLEPDSTQIRWAEWLAAKGVDAVIGTHPHVIQNITAIGKVPVFFSIGNSISNMSARNTRLGLMVTLKFVTDHDSGDKKMLEPEYRFTWCTLPGTLTKGYRTIFVEDYIGRRSEWIDPWDYDNMLITLRRVKDAVMREAH